MMNNNLIRNFEALIKKEKNAEKPNTFRIRAYDKVIKILKSFQKQITCLDDIKGIPGIGAKTLEKIGIILEKGSLPGLDIETETANKLPSETDKLEKVTGIGAVKSRKLVESDWTLEKLRSVFAKNPDELESVLTHHQRLGIKYFDDLEHRIPYEEISEIERFIDSEIKWINNKFYSPEEYRFVICGSYRRKQVNSGDIDILFYNTK